MARCLVLLCVVVSVFNSMAVASDLKARDTKMQAAYKKLDANAEALVLSAFNGFSGAKEGANTDHHVHVVGIGDAVSYFDRHLKQPEGCRASDFRGQPIYINPKRFKFWSNPALNIKTRALMSVTQVTSGPLARLDKMAANDNFIDRLYGLVKYYRPREEGGFSKAPGKFVLLAMDGHYNGGGTVDWHDTDILVPNGYVVRLSGCMNRLYQQDNETTYAPFLPSISINPARHDVDEQLKLYAGQVKHLKWLPNTMNINPAAKSHDSFFNVLKMCGINLMVHTGFEVATEAKPEHQRFGNPTLHERALEKGVSVVMAHSGYKGTSMHLHDGHEANNTELFNEMLARYPESLKGGLSATVFIGDSKCIPHSDFDCYLGKDELLLHLEKILANKDDLYHDQSETRLVNGSDYPLPAVHLLNPTQALMHWGMLAKKDKKSLDRIWKFNPLLFDFVLKRALRVNGDKAAAFPLSAFMPLNTTFDTTACARTLDALPSL